MEVHIPYKMIKLGKHWIYIEIQTNNNFRTKQIYHYFEKVDNTTFSQRFFEHEHFFLSENLYSNILQKLHKKNHHAKKMKHFVNNNQGLLIK